MPKMSKKTQKTTQSDKSSKDRKSVWDAIEKIKTGGNYSEPEDRNGFTKRDTDFFLGKEDKSADIIILSDIPYIIPIHSFKKIVEKDGKTFTFYPTETCLKKDEKECPYCEQASVNKNIRAKHDGIFFPILDLRGKRVEGKYDGNPFPKFAKVTKDVALQIRELIDSLDEDGMKISDVVCEFEKSGKSKIVAIKQRKVSGRQFEDVTVATEITEENGVPVELFVEDYYDGKLPIFSEIWSHKSYEDAEADVDNY